MVLAPIAKVGLVSLMATARDFSVYVPCLTRLYLLMEYNF